jgi:plasmid stabilization system protein ParE
MTLEVRFRRSAENDLEALHDYIAKDSPGACRRVYRQDS